MDHNSSNDSGKRNWRDRLGVGQKSMPKISEDFSKPVEPQLGGAGTGESRSGQPVARPAPMAPRVPRAPQAGERQAGERGGLERHTSHVTPPREGGVQPRPAASRPQPSQPQLSATRPQEGQDDLLAEKLRLQRANAEKLAEQRVSAAKERAEASRYGAEVATPAPKPPSAGSIGGTPSGGARYTAQPRPSAGPAPSITQPLGTTAGTAGQPTPPPPRPKFSFAEEEAKRTETLGAREQWVPPNGQTGQSPQRQMPPQMPPQMPQRGGMPPQGNLLPPRAPLGGNHVPPSLQQGNYPASSPAYQPQAPQGYRPAEGAAGYGGRQPPPRQYPLPPPGYAQRPLGPPPSGYAPVPPPRYNPDGYSPDREDDLQSGYGQHQSGPVPTGYELTPRRPAPPPRPALRAPARHDDDFDEEIFDDDAPQRASKRASATDYNHAYQEQDTYYGELPRKKRGPWLALLALLIVAALVAGGIYFYRMQSSGGAVQADGAGTPPVIAPSEQPIRVPAEPATPDAQQGTAPVTTRKLIFDRMVDDREEPSSTMVQSTEEVPVAPPQESSEGVGTQDMGQEIAPLPAEGGNANGQGAEAPVNGSQPIALPPPPGAPDNAVQGAIPTPSSQQTVAEAVVPQPGVTIQPTTATAQVDPLVTATSQGATPSSQAASPNPVVPAEEEISDVTPAPRPKKTALKADGVKAGSRVKTATQEQLGSTPVVLVPPAITAPKTLSTTPALNQLPDSTATSETLPLGTATGTAPAASGQLAGTAPAAPLDNGATPALKKKKTIMDLFNGGSTTVDAGGASSVATQPPANSAVALPPPIPPAGKVTSTPQAPIKIARVETVPAPEPQASRLGNGYYIQLTSFRSEADANNDFSRVKSRNSVLLGTYAPVVLPTKIGGATRYQLAVGPMANREEASRICTSLVAAGERDCTVKRP